jgi:hypothetical protein
MAEIIVVAAGASAGDTSLPVAPLPIRLELGAVLPFGGSKRAILAAVGAVNQETLIVDPLPQDLAPGDEAIVPSPVTSVGADYSVFLRDFGVPVSYEGGPAGMKGLEDVNALGVLGDDGRAVISSADRTVLIRTDQRGLLTQGSAIAVNGVDRTIRDLGPFEDGAFTLVQLR